MAKIKMTQEMIADVATLYQKKYTDQEIADELKISRWLVGKIRRKYGLIKEKIVYGQKARKKIKERILKNYKKFYDFYWMMDANGISQGKRTYWDVAQKFGITRQQAFHYIKIYRKHLFDFVDDDEAESKITKFVKKELKTLKEKKHVKD